MPGLDTEMEEGSWRMRVLFGSWCVWSREMLQEIRGVDAWQIQYSTLTPFMGGGYRVPELGRNAAVRGSFRSYQPSWGNRRCLLLGIDRYCTTTVRPLV
jgi:hypothetical protein